MLNIEEIFELKNVCETFFLERDVEKPIIFYGCGMGLKSAWDFFEKRGVKPSMICDSNSKKWMSFYNEVEVNSIEEAIKRYSDFYLYISAPTHIQEIYSYVKKHIKEENIVYFNLFEEQEAYKQYLSSEKTFLTDFYNKLSDDKSKNVMESMIKAWITADNNYYFEVVEDEQYFCKDIIELSEDEVFVDVGAFSGDTFEEFVLHANNKYKKAYLLEPNKCNFDYLKEVQKKYKNVEIFYKGAYDKSDRCYFCAPQEMSSSSAFISTDIRTDEFIDVDRLDNMIGDRVTFIKMDIEGAELKAIEGSRFLIKEYKPKLAIAIYHKIEDIVKIPKLITEIRADYSFYIRQHSCYTGETILYAI